MTILKSPPKGWRRPAIPVAVKLYAMREIHPHAPFSVICQPSNSAKLVAMLMVYGKHHFHHVPGLWERKFDTETNDTVPPANDPFYIIAVTPERHDLIENGPGGEKRITSAGSASNYRAKERRLNTPKKSRGPKLRSRGFDKSRTRHFDGTVTRRRRR
jgi:hypothetical protein